MNLIFHHAALGDFVVTFPLLRTLREPTTIVAPWSKAALAAKLFTHVSPMDIELWEFTRLHVVGGPTSVSPAIGDLFGNAHRIISFISKPGDPWAQNIADLAPDAEVAHVRPRPPADWTRHVTQWHRTQLEEQRLAIEPSDDAWTGGKKAAWGAGEGPIVIHPGSGGVDKCWPIDRFEAVIEKLRAAGREVVPVLGEAELERWDRQVVERWQAGYGAQPLYSLDALHDGLRVASGYLGNDSGPTHLAAQLGVPTVAMFGPSDPRVWRPQGPSVTILAPDTPRGMDWLAVNSVVATCGIDA